jgi:hypothetical protein
VLKFGPLSCADCLFNLSQRVPSERDRGFESGFLQRRVGCEPACKIAAKLGIKMTAPIRVRAGVAAIDHPVIFPGRNGIGPRFGQPAIDLRTRVQVKTACWEQQNSTPS